MIGNLEIIGIELSTDIQNPGSDISKKFLECFCFFEAYLVFIQYSFPKLCETWSKKYMERLWKRGK